MVSRDQDFAIQHSRLRPYFVLEYFAGETLDQYLRREKTIPVNGFLPLARQIAEAVHAAHQARIFHRDLKPANVMVRLLSEGATVDDAWTWDVRVIDFGLAVRVQSIRASIAVPASLRSTREKSIAGTIKYAAPEQMGELPGVEVGPYSDVYAFGKTCLELLFQTTEPKGWHWKGLPAEIRDPLQELLERCTAPALAERYSNFAPVLTMLTELNPDTRRQQNVQHERQKHERRNVEDEKHQIEHKRQQARLIRCKAGEARRQQEEGAPGGSRETTTTGRVGTG